MMNLQPRSADWLRPPLREFAPKDLATFRCSLTLTEHVPAALTASWSVAEEPDDPPAGTITVRVIPHGSSWIGAFTWHDAVPEQLLDRATWCIENWLSELLVEAMFIPDHVPGAPAVAAARSLTPVTLDGERGFFATHLRTDSGYLFHPGDDDLKPGTVLRRDTSTRAWLVVETDLAGIGTTGWPGRLYQAEILPPSTMAERIAQIEMNSGFTYAATHTRADAVRILRELPTARLFGDHGDGVERVLRVAEILDEGTAAFLAARRLPDADRLYSSAWARWQGSDDDKNFAHVIRGKNGSPVNHGFSLILSVLGGRTDARIVDEDGESWLPEPWESASLCLLDAAMALGAPDLLEEHEREHLLRPFEALEARLAD